MIQFVTSTGNGAIHPSAHRNTHTHTHTHIVAHITHTPTLTDQISCLGYATPFTFDIYPEIM